MILRAVPPRFHCDFKVLLQEGENSVISGHKTSQSAFMVKLHDSDPTAVHSQSSRCQILAKLPVDMTLNINL